MGAGRSPTSPRHAEWRTEVVRGSCEIPRQLCQLSTADQPPNCDWTERDGLLAPSEGYGLDLDDALVPRRSPNPTERHRSRTTRADDRRRPCALSVPAQQNCSVSAVTDTSEESLPGRVEALGAWALRVPLEYDRTNSSGKEVSDGTSAIAALALAAIAAADARAAAIWGTRLLAWGHHRQTSWWLLDQVGRRVVSGAVQDFWEVHPRGWVRS